MYQQSFKVRATRLTRDERKEQFVRIVESVGSASTRQVAFLAGMTRSQHVLDMLDELVDEGRLRVQTVDYPNGMYAYVFEGAE